MEHAILISILLLIISIIVLLFPPKRINSFYGYRTTKSMKSIENWKISNHFFTIGVIIISSFNILFFYILSSLITNFGKYSFLLFLLFEFVILIYLTEKKITKNENK